MAGGVCAGLPSQLRLHVFVDSTWTRLQTFEITTVDTIATE
jgi:hypothetical protein